MKKMMCLLLITLSPFAASLSNAQQESTKKEKLQFRLGAFYNSHLNYYGRTDSLRSNGFFPVAEIGFTKNVYVTAAPVFVSNAATRFEYAGTVATAGYQVKSRNEKFLTHIYLTKPFYKTSTRLVQSALKEQLSSSISWQNKFLNITAGADVKHSDKLDYGFTAGADHLFRVVFPGEYVLIADPSVNIYTGTQQFTKTYYEKNSFLIFPGTEQAVSKQVNQLNVLSYEVTVPLILSHKCWQIILIPAYVIPQNLVTVQNRPDLTERGKKMLYVTAGAKVIL